MRPNQVPIYLRAVAAPPPAGGSFPTIVGTPVSVAGPAGFTYPAGIAVGDRIYILQVDGSAGGTFSSAYSTYQSGNGNLGTGYTLFYRVADGSEGASTTTSGNGSCQYICWVVRGWDTGTPEEGWSGLSAYNNVSNPSTITIPSSTSTKANCLEFMIVWDNQNNADTVTTAPSGATLIKTQTGAADSISVWYKQQAAAGASGTNTFGWSVAGAWGDAVSFMVRPT